MKCIKEGTEFLDQLKDSVHDLYDENVEKDKEIERLNKILDTLMQDMAILNGCGKREIKPKYIFDRIVMLRGDDKE